MYTSQRAGTNPGPLHLMLAAHRLLTTRRPFASHDHDYFTDLYATYGMLVDETDFAAGRASFTDLVDALLPDLGPYRDRFDLALLASVTSDAEPSWPMCYLSQAVAEPGLAFAIADQGVIAPFTALRLAAQRAAAGEARRVLMFVLDQASLLHTRPVPARLRATEDSAVLLVLDSAGAAPVEVPAPELVEPAAAPDRWAALIKSTQDTTDLAVTAVCGLGLPTPVNGPVEVLGAPSGRPGTAIWSVLAEWQGKWRAEGRRVLLADYDHELRRLAWCVIDIQRADQGVPEP